MVIFCRCPGQIVGIGVIILIIGVLIITIYGVGCLIATQIEIINVYRSVTPGGLFYIQSYSSLYYTAQVIAAKYLAESSAGNREVYITVDIGIVGTSEYHANLC